MGDNCRSDVLVFFVNGKKVTEQSPSPEWRLVYYLRNRLNLTGTKVSCGTGACGACSVIVSKWDISEGKIIHYTANSCLLPLCSLHGAAITTVEGIGSIRKLHPVQESIAKAHGAQCGYCTPGMVVSMSCLLQNNCSPTVEDIEECLQGNLCRCTGYRPIVTGCKTFVENCEEKFSEYDISQCSKIAIVPEEMANGSYVFPELTFKARNLTWFQPVALDSLVKLKATYTKARLVVGNAEAGLTKTLKMETPDVIINIGNVSELNIIELNDKGLNIGGAVTIAKLQKVLKEKVKELAEHQVRVYDFAIDLIALFGGVQIRNVVGVASTIACARNNSDLAVLLLACGAVLKVANATGQRSFKLTADFFLPDQKTALNVDDIIVSILIPYSVKDEYYYVDKQMHRRVNDFAIVNTAMKVHFEENCDTIKDLVLCFGGIRPSIVMATSTASSLIGRQWEENLLSVAYDHLVEELHNLPGNCEGMEDYRLTLCLSFFRKFYASVQQQLYKQGLYKNKPADLDINEQLCIQRKALRAKSAVLNFDDVTLKQPIDDAVGKPVPNQAAFKETTGEAVYVDDIPHVQGELFLALVTSQIAHGKIIEVDASEALQMPGVVDFIDHRDFPAAKSVEFFTHHIPVLVTDKVVNRGQTIGAVIAYSAIVARKAAQKVRIKYENMDYVIRLEEAIKSQSFYAPPVVSIKGNPDDAFNASDHVITGEIKIGGQKHFYMETHGCLVIPKDGDEFEIFSSTQIATIMQQSVSAALGLSANKVTVRVKRIGGGFGGKELDSVYLSVLTSVAAHKLKRPIRCTLDREEDTAIVGGRHPYITHYKAGFNKDGKINALETNLYINAGNGLGGTAMVLFRTSMTLENGYKIPNMKVSGYLCRTNLPCGSSFRGFGAPQASLMIEHIITHMASILDIQPEEIRERNLQTSGDELLFHQTLTSSAVKQCWQEMKEKSNFTQRLIEVEQFNKNSHWLKRGLAAVTVRFGINFFPMGMAQGSALVHINLDGSVSLNHGGIEMGQGLHTKMLQIVTRALNVPLSKVHTIETNTNTVPNTTGTFGSAGSDLNGMAVVNACQTLLERLEPYKKANPTGQWEDWVKAAYLDRVSLSATGFNKIEGEPYNPETQKGEIYTYHVFGAACSEVEVDCLTGSHTILRTDIVMDVGQSLNPAIDIGQIEGAFIQGCGLYTMEEVVYTPEGKLVTDGPTNYKIPTVCDIPQQMNISLLSGSYQPIRTVYSSKGIGEPPLSLSVSVYFAIYKAIAAARSQAGLQGFVQLSSPLTPDKIRLACVDEITKRCEKIANGEDTQSYIHQ